jgi:hypothetical protein
MEHYSVGTDGKDGGSSNDTRRELWRIISGSEVRFMWNITAVVAHPAVQYRLDLILFLTVDESWGWG